MIASTEKIDYNKELAIAVKDGDLEQTLFCLKNSADPHAFIDNDKYFTPWSWVCSCENTQVVKALLEAGADPNARSGTAAYDTVIYGAIMRNNREVIAELVAHGASYDVHDYVGRSPLDLAHILDDGGSMVNYLLELAKSTI